MILLLETFKEMNCYNAEFLENLYNSYPMQYRNKFLKRRNKMSIVITSSNFILFSLFRYTTRIYFMPSLLSNLH